MSVRFLWSASDMEFLPQISEKILKIVFSVLLRDARDPLAPKQGHQRPKITRSIQAQSPSRSPDARAGHRAWRRGQRPSRSPVQTQVKGQIVTGSRARTTEQGRCYRSGNGIYHYADEQFIDSASSEAKNTPMVGKSANMWSHDCSAPRGRTPSTVARRRKGGPNRARNLNHTPRSKPGRIPYLTHPLTRTVFRSPMFHLRRGGPPRHLLFGSAVGVGKWCFTVGVGSPACVGRLAGWDDGGRPSVAGGAFRSIPRPRRVLNEWEELLAPRIPRTFLGHDFLVPGKLTPTGTPGRNRVHFRGWAGSLFRERLRLGRLSSYFTSERDGQQRYPNRSARPSASVGDFELDCSMALLMPSCVPRECCSRKNVLL